MEEQMLKWYTIDTLQKPPTLHVLFQKWKFMTLLYKHMPLEYSAYRNKTMSI